MILVERVPTNVGHPVRGKNVGVALLVCADEGLLGRGRRSSAIVERNIDVGGAVALSGCIGVENSSSLARGPTPARRACAASTVRQQDPSILAGKAAGLARSPRPPAVATASIRCAGVRIHRGSDSRD